MLLVTSLQTWDCKSIAKASKVRILLPGRVGGLSPASSSLAAKSGHGWHALAVAEPHGDRTAHLKRSIPFSVCAGQGHNSAEKAYTAELLAGLDAWPAYYAQMGPANSAGPGAADLSAPEPADAAALRVRLETGEWVVDLRARTAFAAGFVPGTFNFGIDGQFATYLGWLIPWGSPVTLLGETPEQVAEAQRELVRIGIDRPTAAATGCPQEWTDGPLESFDRATFADLAQVRHHRPVAILDVRRVGEWRESHIDGAVNIPIHELLGRVAEVPAGEVWVHCAAGYRASIVASILSAHGVHVVAVDDSYAEQAASSGLPLVTDQGQPTEEVA